MTKSVCALSRRADLSRDAFQAYYEQSHAPLAIRHFPFTRYVRNHLLDTPNIGFDTISEFWADDIAACAALMGGPVGEIMRVDEERFMDRVKVAPAGAEEHVLAKGNATDACGGRYATLIVGGSSEALLDAAQAAVGSSQGVSLDLLQSWSAMAFPADAILWSPSPLRLRPPHGARIVATLRVRRDETSPSLLRGS